jgi:hypothetical protein
VHAGRGGKRENFKKEKENEVEYHCFRGINTLNMKQYILPKHWYLSTKLPTVISYKTVLLITKAH